MSFSLLDLLRGNKKPVPAPQPTPQPGNGSLPSNFVSRVPAGWLPAQPRLDTNGTAQPFAFGAPSPLLKVANPSVPKLQRYGDASGNQWLENDQGQRFNVPVAPQPYDSPLNSSLKDRLRPGITGPYPVDDGVMHTTKPKKPALRFSI